MRYINFITIIIVLIFVSCSSTKKIQLSSYDISDSFKAYLDTVIEEERKCFYYEFGKSAFSFSMQNTDDSVISIEINCEFEETYNYKECFGAFEYNNHIFFCTGIVNEEILTPNQNKITVESRFDEIIIPEGAVTEFCDDRWSSWRYEKFDNNFNCVYHFPCSTQE